MQVQLFTDPSTPHWPNEDFAAVAPGVAVLIDGAGSPGGRDTGCIHGVAWYARTLGGLLASGASDAGMPLAELLRSAIKQIGDMHSGTCDLSHPGTPSATVLVARESGDTLEYLVLADSLLLLQPKSAAPVVITDTRLEDIAGRLRPDYGELPPGAPEREAAIQVYLSELDGLRNQPGGYWTAGADPHAAAEAIAGAMPVSELASIALLSDGVGRLVDRYHQATWIQVSAMLAEHGPKALIRELRSVEAGDADGRRWPRSKIRDDATAVLWTLEARAAVTAG